MVVHRHTRPGFGLTYGADVAGFGIFEVTPPYTYMYIPPKLLLAPSQVACTEASLYVNFYLGT